MPVMILIGGAGAGQNVRDCSDIIDETRQKARCKQEMSGEII